MKKEDYLSFLVSAKKYKISEDVLDIEKFGPEKIISISSTPTWNEEAKARGVTRIVPKSFSDLEGFAKEVAEEIKNILIKNS